MFRGSMLTVDDAIAWAAGGAVVVAWIALAAVCSWLAGRKNRDSGLWFVLGFLSGPIALVAICLLKAAPKGDASGHE